MATRRQLLEAQDAFEAFRDAMDERFAPFGTDAVLDENWATITAWGSANIPGGLSAAARVGFYEISFRECLRAGALKQDSNWKPRAEREKELQDQFDRMPAAEAKQAILSDSTLKTFLDGGAQ